MRPRRASERRSSLRAADRGVEGAPRERAPRERGAVRELVDPARTRRDGERRSSFQLIGELMSGGVAAAVHPSGEETKRARSGSQPHGRGARNRQSRGRGDAPAISSKSRPSGRFSVRRQLQVGRVCPCARRADLPALLCPRAACCALIPRRARRVSSARFVECSSMRALCSVLMVRSTLFRPGLGACSGLIPRPTPSRASGVISEAAS